MKHHRKNNFLTLVLTILLCQGISRTSSSAPLTNAPPKDIQAKDSLNPRDTSATEKEIKDSVQVTPTKPPPEGLGDDPLIPVRNLAKAASTIGGGVLVGTYLDPTRSDIWLYSQMGRSWYEEAQMASEVSFEATMNGFFGFTYGYKWLQQLGEWNEPFFKLAVGGLFNPGENFATFINWKRYQVRFAAGFDDLFHAGRQLRLEAGMNWSGYGISIYSGFNYAF
jgi:hypothetical protein